MHTFDPAATHCGEIQALAAQNDDRFFAIGPSGKPQDGFEGSAADHQGIDAGEEFVVTVALAATGIDPSSAPAISGP